MQEENRENPTNQNQSSPNQVPATKQVEDPIAAVPSAPVSSTGNTSGQGSGAAVPEEVKGWSWAGFFLTWIWGVFNGVSLSLLAFIVPWPIMNIILGVKGKEWAWQGKKWDSPQQFRKTQHNWDLWGIVLLVIPITIIVILIVIVALDPKGNG